jgi:type VI secretion system secreted protein VgrG
MPEYERSHHLHVDGVSTDLLVLRYEGFEGMNQLFQFEIDLASEEAVAFDDVVGKPVTLSTKVYEGEEPRYFHGIASRFEHVEHRPRTIVSRLTLVPKAWRLTQRFDARIFQDKTAVEVIEDVFKGAGLASGTDYKVSIQGTYPKREYCVQYRESDWDFVSRLMEEEGIAYFFEQTDSGHAVNLIDRTAGYPTVQGDATLVFRPPEGALATHVHGKHVTRISYAEEVRSGKVTLRDYDFKKPALSLEAGASGSADADLEVYDYPGEYVVPADGTALAAKRLGELQTSQKIGDGDSTCTHLLPGHTFTLSDHARDFLNQKYMVTRVEHYGTEPAAEAAEERQTPYKNWFEVIPATVRYYPPRVTRRPHIHGAQTAVVVGPSGEEVYTDEFGRVKVQFFWDRLGKKDDKSSCWIRVSQIWAGEAWGGMFIPRINQEVVVAFLEGDPDRPLIVGRVYHGTNVVPYPLPDNKTRSTIKSNTSPGGDGSNELRFEDKKGSEEIYLHGQKDWNIKIENDKTQLVGHDESLEVEQDRTKHVKHDQKETVDNDDTIEIGHDRKETIKNDETVEVKHDRKVTIDNDDTEQVSGKQSLTVVKSQTIEIDGKQDITVVKARTLTVDGDVTETFKKNYALAISSNVTETIDGKVEQKIAKDHTASVGGKLSLTVTGDAVESVTGKKSISVTGDIKITSGASTVTIKPSGEITIQGVQMSIDASGPLKVHGVTVDVKADAQATVKAPLVNVEADGIAKVKGAMIMLDGQMVNVG